MAERARVAHGRAAAAAVHLQAMSRELPIFAPPAGEGRAGSTAARRHPEWLLAPIAGGDGFSDLRRLMRAQNLNTVCEEARCPNLGECWDQRTATVMILGDTCTRACGFCAIKTGRPTWFDADEPRRVAEAVAAMGLEHVVVTSVARDDLPDGGASVFAETILRLRDRCPAMGVEVLIPDFNGQEAPLRAVMEAGPDILNHNVETVERLQAPVRKRARYDRSLGVLERAKSYAAELGRVAYTKSSIMVGLGEERAELSPGLPRPARRGLRHPDPRPVPATDGGPPAAGPLLPPRRVRGDEGRGARARLPARGIGTPRAFLVPRP